ncbi:biotin--[acetyl-CoA-carboxylase] ligase [Fibrella sp. HMF5335]|uniref:Biotin--[acetyl-CoA-carboxylase] ligase n=1 Tax=Fibrella rubiginis TaxID=2817060 RepID=A0A939GN66_9BACT|nr:biotin--[acetyl-CoA-carboxylase] ligase [Fibrella rubiginis]MBO0939891.1 biotin--[acetyl-CoA-carboxylase] ligase [Fibrella rubiginis]
MYKIYPKTLFVGQNIIFLPTCQSTNDEALHLLADGTAYEGDVVATSQQTQGRGQRGNQWEALPGQNLTFSLILQPTFLQASEQFWLNMAVSLAVHDSLAPFISTGLRVKWPNDIYVNDRKMGGILIENALQGYHLAHTVVGIGLNINQTQFGYPNATSLLLEAPYQEGYHLPALLTTLCEQLEKRYLQLRNGHRDTLRASYLQHLYRYQEAHLYEADGQRFYGTIISIDPTGRLGLMVDGGIRYFAFKEVSFVMMTDK